MVRRMGTRDWLRLILLSVLWGGSFFFIAIARAGLPPMTIVAVRLALAALVLWLVLPRLGIAPPRGTRAWLACAAMGIVNNAIPFTLIAWAQGSLASGLASVLNATTPMFTVLLLRLARPPEPLGHARLAGIGFGFWGVAVLSGPGALSGADALPILAMLGATFCYGISGVVGKKFRSLGIAPEAGAMGQLSASALVMLPLAAAVDQPWAGPWPGWGAAGAVIALAVLSTALAYILFYQVLVSAGPANLSLVTFLLPVTAILLGVAFLGEVLLPRHLAGMALIAAGLVAIDGRLPRRLGLPV